jgi:hypothetical protein
MTRRLLEESGLEAACSMGLPVHPLTYPVRMRTS